MMKEVEDAISDRTIIPTEFKMMGIESKTSYVIFTTTRVRVAVALFARAVMPAVLKIYTYLRNQQSLIANVRHRIIPALVAFVANSLSKSLASVQRTITSPPLAEFEAVSEPDDVPTTLERSVECQVLYAPPDGCCDADVIFIHGLHGGIDRTWKQGRWRHDRHRLRHQTPVRSRSSDELCAPTGRSTLKRTVSEVYERSEAARRDERRLEEIAGEWMVVDGEIDSDEGYTNCWPQDWLPIDCPNARVIALNYTTDNLWAPVWVKKRKRTDMVERSDEMIEELVRLGVGTRPIIWVGHSKGGLFIKQIILNVLERHRDRLEIRNIFHRSKAIMFYSVPHKGSSLATFTLPLLRRSVELVEIQRNCNFVLNLHDRFLKICETEFDAEIFSFIETSFTFMSFVYLKIVAYDSADPGIGAKCGVPLDHREICKPAGRDCFLYLELIRLIRKYTNNNAAR